MKRKGILYTFRSHLFAVYICKLITPIHNHYTNTPSQPYQIWPNHMTFLTLAWPVSNPTHCYVDSGFQCQSNLNVLSLKSKLIKVIKIEIELVKINSFNNELNDSMGHMIRITWIKQKWTSHFMLMRTKHVW